MYKGFVLLPEGKYERKKKKNVPRRNPIQTHKISFFVHTFGKICGWQHWMAVPRRACCICVAAYRFWIQVIRVEHFNMVFFGFHFANKHFFFHCSSRKDLFSSHIPHTHAHAHLFYHITPVTHCRKFDAVDSPGCHVEIWSANKSSNENRNYGRSAFAKWF